MFQMGVQRKCKPADTACTIAMVPFGAADADGVESRCHLYSVALTWDPYGPVRKIKKTHILSYSSDLLVYCRDILYKFRMFFGGLNSAQSLPVFSLRSEFGLQVDLLSGSLGV